MEQEWLTICREKGWTKDAPLPDSFLGKNWPKQGKIEDYNRLKLKLLNVAGQAACFYFEEDLIPLLERGQFWRGYKSRTMKGDHRRCHSNSAALWDVNRDKLTLATGYALSRDGMWRQHSWCVNDMSTVIETTEKRVLYYGFLMTPEEAEQFLLENCY
jgi:hypothetical protein